MTVTNGYQKRLVPLEKLEGIQFLRNTEYSVLLVLRGLDYTGAKDISVRSKLFEGNYLFPTEASTALKSLEKTGLVSRTYGKLFKLTAEQSVDFVLKRVQHIGLYGLSQTERNMLRFAAMMDRVGRCDWVQGKEFFRSMSASEYMQLNRFLRAGQLADCCEDYGIKFYKPKQELLSKVEVWRDVTAALKLQIY